MSLKLKPTFLCLFLLVSLNAMAEGIPAHVLLKLPETPAQQSSGIFNNYFCGAVKIAKKAYLTASHCTKKAVPTLGKVVAGQKLQFGTSSSEKFITTVTSIQFPKDTLEIAKAIICNEQGCSVPTRRDWIDISLIKVADENKIPLAALSNPHSLDINHGTKLSISGSDLVMGVVFIPETSEAVVNDIQENIAIAVLSSKYAVVNPGDSGSPVWIENSRGIFELIGITSFAQNKKTLGFTVLANPLIDLFEK